VPGHALSMFVVRQESDRLSGISPKEVIPKWNNPPGLRSLHRRGHTAALHRERQKLHFRERLTATSLHLEGKSLSAKLSAGDRVSLYS
jgi:hypothetical protein